MSDNTNAPGFRQEGGQLSGNVSQQEEQQNTGQQQYVTVDQFNELREELSRNTQGLVDKNANRIEKSLRDQFKELSSAIELQRKAGIQITPEQETALKNKLMLDYYETDFEDGDASGRVQPGQTREQQQLDPVTAQAHKILQEAGLKEIDPNKPEAAKIIWASQFGTEQQYLDAYREYAQSVGQAQSSQQQPTQQQSAQPQTSTRTPTNVGAGGSKQDLMTQYKKEMSQEGLQPYQKLSIRDKYRRQGLNI